MVLLDEILYLDGQSAVCAVRVSPRSRFFEAACGIPNWVGVEYMAQTIGVHAGYLRTRRGLPAQVGLLLGSRSYECDVDGFADGARLEIRAGFLVHDGGGVGVYDCSLGIDGVVQARAQIKAFQPDDIDEYLQRIYGVAP